MDPLDALISKIVQNLLEPAVALIGVLAFLYFVYGVVIFIANAGNEEKRAEGQRHMLWAVIGLAILFGANAIISFINGTVNAVGH